MHNEYISVSEFAKAAGVSRQAIQQRLNTSLAQYVKQDKQGKKTISKDALRLFGDEKSKAKEQESKQGEQGTKEQEARLYDAVFLTVETLRGQLAEKDKLIHELTERLAAAQAAEQQAHALHAGTLQTALIEAAPQPEQQEKTEPQKRGFWEKLTRKK